MQKNLRSGKKIGGVSAAQLLAQAVSAFQADELAEAHRLATIIVEKDKKNVVALHLLGVVEALRRNGATALYLFDRALKIDPRNADIVADKGRVLSEMGRHAEALPCYERAVSLNPKHGIALYNQGCSLLALDCPADALGLFDRLIALAPDHAPAHHGRALALTDLRRFGDAIESSGQALTLNPDYAEALQARGLAHTAMHRHELALADFKKAARLNPDLENLQASLVLAKMFCCDWDRIAQEQSSLDNAVRSGRTVAPFTFCVVSNSPQDQLICSRSYAARKYPSIMPPLWDGQKYEHDRIRVGYVSADFHEHPTAFLMAGLFEEHDRSRFEIIAVSVGRDDGSDIRKRIQSSVEKFIDAKAMTEADIAELIRQHEIDVLLDLKGFTEDSRFGIFPYRAAPIQVSYLGFPGTTGADCIDYVVADRTLVPADHHAFYSEKIVALPHSYQINDAQRSIADTAGTRAELGLPAAGFVFCCFNGNYKITPDVFDVWMRILKQVEGSVLWLFESNATAASNLRKEAAARGVNPERLIFATRLPLAEHLARHRFADLFLDTLPCNAHTTASDALWAGLPVVTCLGTTFAGRVAASLLNAIGLPELTTTTLEAYEALAIELATQPEKLACIKETLAANRLTTPLFDTRLSTRHLEAAFSAMHERHQAGLPPDHIAVPG
jgi:protein O-GlcNAc transferase